MNTPPAVIPALADPWRASFALFLSPAAYYELAIAHDLAVNLKARDLAAAYARGEYPKPEWEAEARTRVREHATQLRSGLLASLVLTFAFLSLGLLLGVAAGKVAPSLPIAEGKWLSTVGGLLAAWATLFELGGYAKTFSEEALHETVRPVLFKSMFLPGIAIAALGQVW